MIIMNNKWFKSVWASQNHESWNASVPIGDLMINTTVEPCLYNHQKGHENLTILMEWLY